MKTIIWICFNEVVLKLNLSHAALFYHNILVDGFTSGNSRLMKQKSSKLPNINALQSLNS
mgnify:CR=1 FL=1